ncbi:ABC transporter substrate-binding protein [Pokkaliibacter sp. CJK22405]|uniref:ABC transporter substrate-binding protein n=1 Tax=Pokkaliibacter sp. CJK22405 TaxID=3384615 RepID=UPI003985517A
MTRRPTPFLRHSLAFALSTALLGASASVLAADLKVGLASEVTSMDPHFANIAPNIAMSHHIFETLVTVNPEGQLVPCLATSWKAISPTVWEFKLRDGVTFSDGTPLTAADVVYSLERPATILNSPGPFTSATKHIVKMEAVDDHTVHLTTSEPYGPLGLDISDIFIVSKKATEGLTTEDFNAGKGVIGTGPYKLDSFQKGETIELTRNDSYWGDKPEWEHVTFRILPSSAPRLSALLSGNVDMIESVPPADLARLKTDKNITIAQHTTWRTLFWQMDQFRDKSPDITDAEGKPLDKNPLKDVRVRKAMSMAINRQALAERTLEGLGVPASNINAPGIFGYNDDIKVEKYDPEGAKKLLAEAGYPHGFGITLHGPAGRYINDEQVAQTVAQFLNRVGIKAKVVTEPVSVYFGHARAHDYSMALLGWGSLAADFTLRSIVGTPNTETGFGSWNWGEYSNPEVDKLVEESLSSVDNDKRSELAQKAVGVAMRDYAVIPSHHQLATWALRKGLDYPGRVDEFTYAFEVHSDK